MQRVVRLETIADVHDDGDAGPAATVEGSRPLPRDVPGWAEAPPQSGEADPRRISVSVRHEAVMDDGSRLLLLDDRGWTQEARGAGANEIDDLWALTTERDIVETARAVVGPDEPFGGRSQDDMETGHWNTLAENLRAQGVVADAGQLRRLPHDVVLSDRLRARLRKVPAAPPQG
jgi:hypothetical protein